MIDGKAAHPIAFIISLNKRACDDRNNSKSNKFNRLLNRERHSKKPSNGMPNESSPLCPSFFLITGLQVTGLRITGLLVAFN